MKTPVAAAFRFAAAACAGMSGSGGVPGPSGDAFRVAVFGDMPYGAAGTEQGVADVADYRNVLGNPNHHALIMIVDPASPNLFRFEPLVVPRNTR